MNELEKENLVNEVLTRINEMSEEDKKQKNIENRKVLSKLTEYFVGKFKEYDSRHPYDAVHGEKVNGPHLWCAYRQIRAIVPWFVSVRYSNSENWDEFYKENPGAKRRETHTSVVNQMLEEDSELALSIGKQMVDILFAYLEPDSWNEKQAAENRKEKPRRSPMTKIRGWK